VAYAAEHAGDCTWTGVTTSGISVVGNTERTLIMLQNFINNIKTHITELETAIADGTIEGGEELVKLKAEAAVLLARLEILLGNL
jgi:hypothetical protein